MDIESLYTAPAHDKGAEMQVKGPDGKSKECFISFIGCDSKVWRELYRKAQRDALLEDKEPDEAWMLSEAATGWRGFSENGKEIKFSRDKLKQLFINAPYILDQANAFVGTRGNFTKS